jgi:phospholipid/cholesterol/gamma-HCH transport system substrate-binding protein
MHTTKTVEVVVGAFVALGLAALFMLAMKVSNLSSFTDDEGYSVTARFENIGGLKVRSPVTVAGVRVGRVEEIGFDNETFEAVVKVNISANYNQLPEDTFASIFTAGLLGEQYIGLEPGGSEKLLKQGSEIRQTQSAIVLEQIIGQFLYSKAEGDK